MKRRRNRIDGQFAARPIAMLESPAYRALSLAGHRVVSRVEVELAHHGGNDNGRLPVTFDQFVEYGLHRHSIGPAMREAVALGFLIITEKGRAGNAEHRNPNRFRLTYRFAEDIPGDGSHEWRSIKTLEEAEELAHAARKAKGIKKTKNQCRKMPSFGDKNRHRKPKIPVTKTATTGVAKTVTTSISRDIPPTQQAREARPSGSAVASGLAATERDDVVQSRIASRLGGGAGAWVTLQAIPDELLAQLVESERTGALTDETVQTVRQKYLQRGAA
jgi:hypothetical protein